MSRSGSHRQARPSTTRRRTSRSGSCRQARPSAPRRRTSRGGSHRRARASTSRRRTSRGGSHRRARASTSRRRTSRSGSHRRARASTSRRQAKTSRPRPARPTATPTTPRSCCGSPSARGWTWRRSTAAVATGACASRIYWPSSSSAATTCRSLHFT
jgi:hypothetical protein